MIGIDILEINRIEKLDKTAFCNKVFTLQEVAYLESKRFANESIAGMFCGKEAVSKALGRGINNGIAFKDIEILHDKFGKPIVNLSNEAAKIIKTLGDKIDLSISHTSSIATAIAIISKIN